MRRILMRWGVLSVWVFAACTTREAGVGVGAEGGAGAGVRVGVEQEAGVGAAAGVGAGREPGTGTGTGTGSEAGVGEARWRGFRGEGFSVLFPGEPKVTVLPADDEKVGYTEAKVELPGGQVSFVAGFSEYPAAEITSPDRFLEEHANAPRRGLTDVLHKRVVTLPGGHPGRVLILRRNISGTPLRVYSRLYLVRNTLYSLIVSTLDVGGVDEQVVKMFMDSFKLL